MAHLLRGWLASGLGAAGLALVLQACGGAAEQPAEKAPIDLAESVEPERVILISLDTLRADYLGLYGYREHPTSPNLDALAEECVVFEESVVVEPFTLTSHMSLMTGLYPERHGVTPERGLRPGVTTLAARLGQAGYTSAAFTDGGWMRNKWGLSRGFELYRGAKRRGLKAILAEAGAWLEQLESERFLLFLHTYDVHGLGTEPNYQSDPELRGSFSAGLDSKLKSSDERSFKRLFRKHADLDEVDEAYIRATYAECVRHVDRELGRFLEDLRARGWYEDSLIVVWSDHGEGLAEHGEWGHGELFEHTIRAPLLIKLPGAVGAGRRVRGVVSGVDLLPTILELVGEFPPEGLDGRSLVPLLLGQGELVSDGEAFSVSEGQGRPRAARASHETLYSLRRGRWHAILNSVSGERMLFDLVTDPGEQHNLWPAAGEQRAEAEQLFARLEQWSAAYRARRERDAGGAGGSDPDMDASTEAELRALGYMDSEEDED